MLIPLRRAVVFALAWALLGVATIVQPAWLVVWQLAGLAFLGALGADAWLARSVAVGVTCRRDVPRILPVAEWHPITLQLMAGGRAVAGALQEGVPAGFESEQDHQRFALAAGQFVRLSYRVRPLVRGPHQLGPTIARFESPLGFWCVQRVIGTVDTVRVYPDFARLTQYELLATDHRLSQMGVLQRQRRGEGAEFHQLRDYRQDDSPRQIDWKATARMARLISREYEDERDQQIVLVLDCSHRMRTKDGDLSHFDHTLNATLLLAYVALRQGDAVGLVTCGHDQLRFLAPRASLGTVPRLLNAVYDLQPSLRAPDYVRVALELRQRLSRRALIVMATVVRDEDAEALRGATHLLRTHRLVVASLAEAAVATARQTPIATLDDALTYAAATDYWVRHRRTVTTLRHAGVAVLDSTPGHLARQLVNHYWERKRAGAA